MTLARFENLGSQMGGTVQIHGHRAQIHIPRSDSAILVYNRRGQLHRESDR